jgi:regulator of nucleoside diphosphate kinase
MIGRYDIYPFIAGTFSMVGGNFFSFKMVIDMGKKIFTKFNYERLRSIISDDESLSGEDTSKVNLIKYYLKHAKLVDPSDIQPNVITMNSTFSLINIGNGKKEIRSLVFPDEQHNDETKINIFSEIGTQVLGSSIGTVIKAGPRENKYYVIEEVLYQPEAAGDFHV